MSETNETYANGELMSQTDDYAAATQRAIYTGHPELSYQAEQKVRDGASQDEAATWLQAEIDKLYEESEPEPEPVPHTLEDGVGSPDAAVAAEAERVAQVQAAAVNPSSEDEPKETAKQRKAREKAEADQGDDGSGGSDSRF